MRTASFCIIILILMVLPALAGCNRPTADTGAQTPDITQAYQTVQARLTLAATTTVLASPTLQPSATIQPSPTSPIQSLQPSPTPATPQPTVATKLCDQAAPGVPIDVTVPDDTQFAPGQTFTKTWRLTNTGTCTWTTDYSIAVFSGEPMGTKTAVQLPGSVTPGQSIDISVDLTAPLTAATYQGNWKLRNASGAWFGIGPNGNSPFWVKIVVAGSATTTATPGTITPTATTSLATPYPGQDPDTEVTGSNSMVPGDVIDLDTNQVNKGSGDLAFEADGEKLRLAPKGSALFSIYGNNVPNYGACSTAPLSNLGLSLAKLSAGMYLCYRTDQGLYGVIRLVSFDPKNKNTLGFQMLTWAKP